MKRSLFRLVAVAALALAGSAQAAGFVGLMDANGAQTGIPGNPLPVTSGAPATLTPAQVSVASSATLIAALRSTRKLLIVVNTTTTAIYLGPDNTVTTSTGLLLPGVVGASLTVPYTGPLYGIVATGTAIVTEAETY